MSVKQKPKEIFVEKHGKFATYFEKFNMYVIRSPNSVSFQSYSPDLLVLYNNTSLAQYSFQHYRESIVDLSQPLTMDDYNKMFNHCEQLAREGKLYVQLDGGGHRSVSSNEITSSAYEI